MGPKRKALDEGELALEHGLTEQETTGHDGDGQEADTGEGTGFGRAFLQILGKEGPQGSGAAPILVKQHRAVAAAAEAERAEQAGQQEAKRQRKEVGQGTQTQNASRLAGGTAVGSQCRAASVMMGIGATKSLMELLQILTIACSSYRPKWWQFLSTRSQAEVSRKRTFPLCLAESRHRF